MPFTSSDKIAKAKKIKYKTRYSVVFRCDGCCTTVQESDNFCSKCGVEFEKEIEENSELVKCSKCNIDIGPTIKRLFIDTEKKQQVCPRCWERECEERFSRSNKSA